MPSRIALKYFFCDSQKKMLYINARQKRLNAMQVVSDIVRFCQFEIIKFRKGDDDKDLSINGKCPYFRIFTDVLLLNFQGTFIF